MDGLEGLEAIMERLDALDGDEMRAAVERGVKQGAEVIRAQAANNIRPSGRRSEEIKQSIIVKSAREPDKITAAVVATHEEAIYEEFGTGQVGEQNHEGISPHVAVTYNMRAPRKYVWTWNRTLKSGETKNFRREKITLGWFYPKRRGDGKGSEWGFTMGQPAHPFLYPAFVSQRSAAKKLVEDEVKKVVRGE